MEALAHVISGELYAGYFKELVVWGLILGGLHYHDPARIDLLLDAYGSDMGRLSAAGLIGLMILMHTWRRRVLPRRVVAKLDAMKERKGWREDFRTVYMELVKTVDTDRITRKIRDEVVPEMLKLKPEIDKKINLNIENLDSAEMEENPQWQEMMESSGLADKLKEMSEIQEEGGRCDARHV